MNAPRSLVVTRSPQESVLAREIFSDVADKWALLIINVLDERTLRFTELRNEVDGICDWTLAYLARIEEARRHFDGAVQPGGPPAH